MLWLQPHFYPTLIPMPPSISWSMHPILLLEQSYNSRLMMIGNQSLFSLAPYHLASASIAHLIASFWPPSWQCNIFNIISTTPISHSYRSQTTHLCHQLTQHTTLTPPSTSVGLYFPVYNGSSTRSWGTESCRRCPFTYAG